jgi:zinc/manganese transport system permease protein
VSWELLDWYIMGPAIVAGMLVLSTHVPLGQVVLRRGIIFIDLAVAQVAALGVQVAAVGAALLAAAGLNWTEKYWPDIQEALIGTLFVLAATGSILLLAENPHGGDYLRDILVGQILWTTWGMLVPIALLYAVLLSVWFTARERIGRVGFYVTFAFAITAAVQIVGVYLVFASLILPALATRRLDGKARLAAGYLVGVISYLSGIAVSSVLDLPTGAVIVWTMAVASMAAGFLINRRAGAS